MAAADEAGGGVAEAADLVGRDDEVAILVRFLADDSPSAAGLVIAGEAGIGKSAIWAAAVAAARARPGRVLLGRPVEAELDLSFAALDDLLGDVAGEVLGELAPPQRQALEVALLLREPDSGATDARALGSAVRAALAILARDGPVVVAIDDLPWLDRPTGDALAFALRRAHDLPVRLLATVRTNLGGTDEAAHPVLAALPAGRVQRVDVPGLSLGALGHVLRDRLGKPIARRALLAVHEATGGNPFAAIEIARATGDRPGDGLVTHPATLGRGVESLVGDRVTRLPPATQTVLVLAAADGQASLAALRRATGRDPGPALAAAIAQGVVALDGGRVRFSHPLFATAAYAGATATERAAAHRALAGAAADPVAIARHLALGTVRPSAVASDGVERGALIAAARGAPAVAGDLMAAARRLSPSAHPRRWTRSVAEARFRWAVGEMRTARSLLDDALPHLVGRERGQAELLLAVIVEWLDGPTPAVAILRRALRTETLEPDLEAGARLRLSVIVERARVTERQAAIAAARLAAPGAPPAFDLRACAALLGVDAALRLGRGWRADDHEAGLAWLCRHGAAHDTLATFPAASIAEERAWILALMRDDLHGARNRLAAAEAKAAEVGWERSRVIHLSDLGIVESLLGEMDAADAHARAAAQLVELSGASPYAQAQALLAGASVHATRGQLVEARLAIARALELRPAADVWLTARIRGLLGAVELQDGRLAAAADALDRVAAVVRRVGEREPADLRHEGDRLEVAVGLGRLEVAREILADLEARRTIAGRPWLDVMVARGRALVLAAAGDAAGALAALDPDGSIHDSLAMPLERGRTHLAEGRLRRRLRQKRQAREAFARAADLFGSLGARRWAAIAADELARTGVRAPTPHELTETERVVAELAARGRTNREVAQAAFLSPKSVDGVLVRVYQKLGIHSRAELGAWLEAAKAAVGDRDRPPTDP